MNLIHIPRPMIQELLDNDKKNNFSRRRNLDICVKIPYRGYEISVATDARAELDDFVGAGIRIYHNDQNVTDAFLPTTEHMPGATASGEMLKTAFASIDKFLDSEAALGRIGAFLDSKSKGKEG